MHGTKYLILSLALCALSESCQGQKPAVSPSNDTPEETITNMVDTTTNLFTIDYLTGKYEPAEHPDFVLIPKQYADEEGRYLRKDALADFIRMHDAAVLDGVHLIIKSATRNFKNQKRIWENKWTGKTILEDNVNAATDIATDIDRAKKILEYSSMPGSSRHHWGTDIDLNAFTNEWFDAGDGKKIYTWLLAHGHEYGFCQPYTAKGPERMTGYFEERWHWSYMPISKQLTALAQSSLTDDMITGFLGSNTAKDIQVVNNYVLGINPACIATQK